jgi:hypothetical protein
MRRDSVQKIITTPKVLTNNHTNNEKIENVERENKNEISQNIDFDAIKPPNFHRRSLSLNQTNIKSNNINEKDSLLRISVSTDQSEEDLVILRKKHKISMKPEISKKITDELEGIYTFL